MSITAKEVILGGGALDQAISVGLTDAIIDTIAAVAAKKKSSQHSDYACEVQIFTEAEVSRCQSFYTASPNSPAGGGFYEPEKFMEKSRLLQVHVSCSEAETSQTVSGKLSTADYYRENPAQKRLNLLYATTRVGHMLPDAKDVITAEYSDGADVFKSAKTTLISSDQLNWLEAAIRFDSEGIIMPFTISRCADDDATYTTVSTERGWITVTFSGDYETSSMCSDILITLKRSKLCHKTGEAFGKLISHGLYSVVSFEGAPAELKTFYHIVQDIERPKVRRRIIPAFAT